MITAAALFAKYRNPVVVGITVATAMLLMFALSECSKRDAKRAVAVQAEQTTKSGQAIADAASVAVEAVDKRHGAEAAIDVATAIAVRNIDDATTSEDIHSAVTAAVCERVRASGRTDPACVVRKADPR